MLYIAERSYRGRAVGESKGYIRPMHFPWQQFGSTAFLERRGMADNGFEDISISQRNIINLEFDL